MDLHEVPRYGHPVGEAVVAHSLHHEIQRTFLLLCVAFSLLPPCLASIRSAVTFVNSPAAFLYSSVDCFFGH